MNHSAWINIKNWIVIVAMLSALSFCSYAAVKYKKNREIKEKNKVENVYKKGKFSNIKECLTYIEIDIPYEKVYIEDKPSLVWGGFNGTDGTFRCELIVSGSMGIYAEGYYAVPVTALRQNVRNK